MFPLGDYDTTETVIIPFNTFTSDDPSASATITNLAAGDVEIHKDGSTTQRASDNGVTVTIDFDSVTGNHIVSIDLSDNSDAGFYAAGSRYQVRMEGTTVDGATINAWVGAFSIGCTLRPTTAGRKLDVAATGEAGVDLGNVTGTLTQANVGWVDANSRVDVGMWLGTAVTTSSTSTKPEVDVASISDDATAANNLELATENAAAGYIAADLTHIHGTALTETAGQLAGRFVNFFDQASATFNVATALASFKATGFSTHNAAAVADAVWDEAQADHVAAGSFGIIASEIAAIPTTAMRGTDSAYTGTPPTAGAIADAVWDEAYAGHVDAGSFGILIGAAFEEV